MPCSGSAKAPRARATSRRTAPIPSAPAAAGAFRVWRAGPAPRFAPGSLPARRIEAEAERLQRGLHADPARTDGRLERLARKRQRAGSRQRAEQHRRYDAAGAFGQLGHVERDPLFGRNAGRRIDLAGIGHAVAGTDFSETASARCDEAISVVRSGVTSPRWMARPASMNSAPITMSTSPGRGHEREYGAAILPALSRRGQQFHIVERRARALGDARDRSSLGDVVLRLGQRHDPVDQHPAALAAHGVHGEGDGAGVGHNDTGVVVE